VLGRDNMSACDKHGYCSDRSKLSFSTQMVANFDGGLLRRFSAQ
jgi:hypothetical protein